MAEGEAHPGRHDGSLRLSFVSMAAAVCEDLFILLGRVGLRQRARAYPVNDALGHRIEMDG